MNRINHFLSAINVPAWFVRPRWGRRFAAIPKATNLGLRRSPTGMYYKLETLEADIQKGLGELKQMI
ncbi:MAG TPA: hypothetical protein VIO15_08525 [Bacteroidales bacterium]